MDLFPEAQTFLDGMIVAKKHNVIEEYTQVFLHTYKQTGNAKHSKFNALKIALNERDTEILPVYQI
jgi:hypothetical protein